MISKAVRTCGLKWIASTLVLCLVIQDFSYAAPELLKADLGWRIEDGGQKQKNLHWAKKLLPPIPESVATIEDAYQVPQGSDPSGTKTVILIQDPHTNFSGQKNIAKILESLLSSSKALAMSSPRSLIGDQTDSRLRGNDEPFVFVEAGFGDVSLTALKGADPKKRENVGLKYLRAGELSGPEYLNLTTKNDFTLLGVEDESLYWQSLEVYRAIVKKRQKFQEYLEKAANTAQILKSKTFNPFLLAFDQKHEDFLKEKIAIADYFVALMDQARALGLEVARYPNAQKFSHLKEQESRINFDLAGREQLKAVASLSSADQEELKPALSSSSAKSGHAQQLVLVKLLEEKIKNLEAYPNLKLYLEYLNQSQHLNTPELLEEQKLLEAAVYKALIQVPDEEALHKASLALRNLKALLNLTLTPDEFRAYEENPKDFDITKMSGFLNRRIMELKDNYDKAIFLEEGYEEILQKCRTFYELTRKRDEKFVEKIQREWIKMDGGLRMDDRGKHNPPSSILNPRSGISILITGGYHSPNLKALLKSKNISYVSVTPQVLGETNRKRYEELLLSEKPAGNSANADKMGILALVNRPLTPAVSRLATMKDLAKELQVTLPSAARLAGQSVDEQIAALQRKLLDALKPSIIHPASWESLSADSFSDTTKLFIKSLSTDESKLVTFAENVLKNIDLLVGIHQDELTKMISEANAIIAQMKEERSSLAVTLPSFGQWLALPTMNYRDIASYKEQHRKFLIYVKTYDDINAATLRAGLNGSHLRRYYDPDDEVDLLVLKPLLKFIFGYLKRHDDLSSELKRDIHRAVINSLVFPAFQQALSQESWEDIKDKSFVETISAILDTEDRVLVSHMAREVAQDPLLLKKSASLPDYLAGEIGSLSLGNIHEIQLRNANHLIQTPADPAMTAYEWVTGQKILGELVSDSLREQLTLNFKDLQNLGVDAGVRLANEETLENKLKFQLVGGYEPGSGNLIVVKMPGNKALILDLGHDPKSDTPIEQKSVKLREALGGYTPVAAFITHAHLDHCLYAPWFHRDYPDAKIISSQTTARLLFDQWKDVLGGGARIPRIAWLQLVGKVFASLVTIKTGQWYQAQEDVKIFMSHAGHIPGAVSLTVATPYGNFTYSGDTSTTSRLTLPPNAMSPPALQTGTFIVDATNAHQNLPPIEERRKMLVDAVRETYNRGGKVLIPAFILGRAEEIALILKQAVERGELPKNFPIYMDGGAVETVKKLRGDPDYAEFKSWFRNDSPIREITDSDHPDKDPCVIIAGSGMLYGGTAIGHLEKLIEDEKNTVIMVGWLAEDSPAFRLLRTAKGKDFTFPPFRDGRTSATKKVQAKILHINFTAHGDHAEVVQLIQKVDSKVVVLVHAGEEARRSLREDPALSGYTIINNFSDASPIESAPSPEAQGQFSKIKAIELPAKQAQQFRDRQVALKTSSWLKDFDNKELQFYRTSGVSREQLKEALRIYFDARYDEEERKVKPTAEKNLRAEFKRGSPAEDALAAWKFLVKANTASPAARLASAYESEWRSFKRIINFPRIVSSGTSVNNFSSAFNISSLIIGWNFITMIPHVLEAGYRVWTDEKSGNEGIFRVFQGFGGKVESGLNVLERQAGVIFQYLVRSFPGFEKLQDDVHRHSGADKTSSPVVDLFITVNVGTDWLLHSPSIAQSLRLGNRVGFSLAGTASHLRGVHFQGVESYFSPPDDLRIITQKNLSYLNVSIDDLSRRIRQEIDRYEAQSARTKSTTLTPRSKNSARALIYLADPKQSLILSVDALNKLNLKKHQFMSVANYLSLKGLARKSIERSAIPHLGGTQKRNVVKLTITPRGRELVELHRGGEADALAGAIQGALNLSREGARLAGKQAPAADSAVPSTPWTLAKEDVIAVIHNNEDARNLLAELLRGPSFGFTTVLVCKGLGDIPGEFEKLGLYEGDRVIKLAIRPDQRGGRTQFIFALKSSVNVAGGRNLPRFFVAEKDIKFIGNPILGNLWIDASDVEIALKAELEALGASAPVKTSKTMKVRKLTKAAQDSARMVSYLAKIKSHAITVTEANKKWSLEPKDFPNTVRYLNARGLISTDKVVARVPHFGGSTRKSEVTRATLLPIGLDLVARYPLADQDEEMLQALAHGIQDLREARSKSKPAAIKVKSAKPHTVKATPQSKKLANRLMMLGKQPDDDSLSIATSGHEMMTESMWHSIDEWLKDLELIYIKTEVLAAGRKAKSIEIQRNVTLTNQGADLLEAYLKNLNGLAQAIQGLLDAYDGARLADAPRPISLTDTVLVLHHDNLICQRLADLLEKRFEYTRVISLQSRDLIPGEFKRRELDVEANPIRLVISPGYTKDAVQFYRNLSKSLKVSRILALHQYFDAPPKLIKSSILGRRLADDLVVEEELERELGGNGVSKNKPSKQSVTKLTKKSIDSARLLLYMRQNDLLVMYSQDIKEAIEQSSTDIVHMAAYLVPIGIVEKEVIDLTPPTAGRSITTKLTLTETAANLASQYPNDETGLARAIQDIYESQGNGHAGRLKKSGRAEGARLASPADEGWALSKTDAVAVMHENQGVRERLTEALENMGYTSVLAFRNRAELTYTSESVDLSSAPKIKLLIAPGKGLAAAQFGQSLRAARTILGALLADDLKIIRETGLAYTLSPEDHFMNLLQLKLDEVQGLTDAARVDRPAAEPTLVQKAAAKVLVYLAGQPEASVHFLQAGDLWEMDPKTFSKAARQYLLPLKLVSRKEVPVEIADKRQGTRTISTKELSIEDPGRELVTKYQGDPDALARAIKDLERPVLADGARLAESGKKMKSTGAAWPWIVSATEPIAVMEWNDDAREKLVEALREIGFTKVLSFKDRGQALNQDMYHDLSLGKDFIRLLVTPDKRIRPDKALSPYRVLPLTDSQAQTRQYFHEDPWVIQGVYLKSKSTDLETLVKMLKKELDTISFPDRTPDSPPVRRTPTPYELKLASALVALAAQSHPIIDGPDAEQLWGVNRDGSYTIQENLQAIGLIDVGERRKRSVQSNGSLRNVRVNTLALTPLGRDLADRHKEDPEALARQLQLLRRKIKADAAAIPQSGSATGARLAAPEEAAGMLQVTDSVAVIHPDAEARGRLVRAMEKRGFESVIASNSLGGINQLFRQNTSQLTGGPIRLIIAPGFKRSASNVLGYLPQDVRPKFVSQDLILIRQPARDLSVDNEGEVEAALDAALKKVQAIVEVTPVKSALWAERSAAILIYLADSNHPTLSTLEVMQMYEFSHTSIFSALKRYLQSMNLVESKFIPASSIVGGGEKNTQVTQLTLSPEGRRVVAESEGDQKVLALAIQNIYTAAAAAKRARAKAYPAKIGARLAEESRGPRLAGFGATLAGFDELVLAVNSQGHLMALETSDRIAILSFRKKFPGQVQVYVGNRPFRIVKSRSGKTRGAQAAELISYQDLINTLKAFDRRFNQPLPKELAEKPIEAYLHLDSFKGLSIQDQAEAVKTLIYSIAARKTKYLEIHLVGEDRLVKLAQAVIASSSRLREKPFTVGDQIQHQEASQVHLLSQDYLKINRIALLGQATAKGVKARFVKIQDLVHDNNMEDIVLPNPLLSLMDRVGAIENLSVEDAVFNQVYEWFKNLTGFALSKEEFLGLILGDEALINLYAVPPTLRAVDLAEAMNAHAHFRRLSEQAA